MIFPIPVNQPLLNGDEKNFLTECIDSGWISSEGPFVKQFEEQFAARVGRRYGIAVSNGSAALEVAIAALEIGQGDEVILPTFTIISCAAAIVRAGATPIVIDCDPETWNMDTRQIEQHITKNTKAIMVVHIYGFPVDMNPVMALAEKYGLHIIEDAAEVIGQTYHGRPCGSFGNVSTFSFYSNKHVTTGEGGMLVTDDAALAERCQSLRNLCFLPEQRFVHEELGWNFRMTNLQAALGVAQLKRLDELIVRKRQMGQYYSELLADVTEIQLPLPYTAYSDNIYWVYGIVLKQHVSFDAKEAMRRLAQKNIGTRPFFWPMHEQPVFQKMGLCEGISCPNAEYIARRGFYLPSGLALTKHQMEQVVLTLKEILR
ncbi:glutamine--scyllo-inositol transaminase [Candidatus Vecturithrix granuli]|uniref:Glutamine--scyllo-inositol transaminase n=1 Tax=Vecturithrix granuli TaxID=1499967 RepID=A0A0S6W6P2_VECG1|nr:glutamine--scyllo-inositol transaminase [Candidatus Vecturithrix granuli]